MEWIAITDRLPEDKPNDPNVFITCDKDGFVYGSNNYFGGNSMGKDGFYNLINGDWEYDEDVRYWMPLPIGVLSNNKKHYENKKRSNNNKKPTS